MPRKKQRSNKKQKRVSLTSTKGLIQWTATAEQARYDKLLPKPRHEVTADRTLVIDGNNMAYRAYYAYSKLKGVEIIYGMLKILETLIRQNKPEKLVICWDGKRNPKRVELLPQYKSHRDKQRQDNPKARKRILRQIKRVKKLLYYLGVPQAWHEDIEGDDMVYLVAKEESKLRRVMIVSGDKDMLQLVNHDISVYNPRPKYAVNRSPFAFSVQEPFVEIPQIVDYLCLVGDTSDDIPGIRGIGPKRACEFLRRWYTVKDYLEDEDAIFTGMADKDKVRKIYKRNRRLIDLALFHRKYQPEAKVTWYRGKAFPPFNSEKYMLMCNKYNLKSFKSEKFISLFTS